MAVSVHWGLRMTMTRCRKPGCKLTQWRAQLCYRHAKEAAGFRFDPESGRFLPLHSRTGDSASRQEERRNPAPGRPESESALSFA